MAWRTTPLHDREVVDALVDPAHAAPSPALAAALRDWPGTYYWSNEPEGRHLVLTRPTVRRREAWGLHVILFISVLALMTLSGAIFGGAISADFEAWRMPYLLRELPVGLWFSLPLLAILLCHELGHYLTARAYQLDVSPPFFIPGLPAPIGIGTFGAFIRLRTVVSDRRQLLDVGAAGPIAGFIVALPLLLVGIARSHAVPDAPVSGMIVPFGGDALLLGDSLVTMLARRLVLGSAVISSGAIALHPLAVAGWFGMFVTMLNLLPIAQLDGGHIVYATLPRWHRNVARLLWVVTIGLSRLSWTWLFWGVIILALSRGRLDHPPVLDAYRPLPRSRWWLPAVSLVLFVLTFAPVPFRR